MSVPICANRGISLFRAFCLSLCLVLLLVNLFLASVMSPQHAYASTTFDCDAVTEIPQAECESLVALYESTDGPNWEVYGWLATTKPCSWPGVWCTDGSVTSLNLGGFCGDYCRSLNLSGNIPAEIGNLPNLEILDFQVNRITGIPAEIGKLTKLNQLNLSYNAISSLPPGIGGLNALNYLNLSFNQLTNLPAEIGNLSNLEVLEAAYNTLGSLPPEIGDLSLLERLHLGYNQLASLPPGIGNLSTLYYLDLNGNQLTTLPPEVGNLASLYSLYLNDNQLTSLPPEIGRIIGLDALWLSYNQLNSLPAEIGNLSNLGSLSLNSNQLGSLPTTIGNLSSLRGLHLSENQLASLPPGIGNLSTLYSLDLNGNQLTSLPPEIGNLSELYYLSADNNQLSQLPATINHLSALRSMNMANNQLSSLPAEIGNLKNLDWLALKNNQLSSLPAEIGDLASLAYLDLAYNQLSSLPAEIGDLSWLGYLDLSHNQLSSLPAEIGNLASLGYLDLGDNRLSSLRAGLIDLPYLNFLNVAYNRLTIMNASMLNFLSRLAPNWADTQTVPPHNIHLSGAGPGSLVFTWRPIRYSIGGGAYELSYATNPGGPYVVHGTTSDKTSSQYLADSLPDSSEYYARLRTFSAAEGEQLQDLWSNYSPMIAVLKTPVSSFSGASLEYTDSEGQTTWVEVPGGAVNLDGMLYFSTSAGAELPVHLRLAGQAFNLAMLLDDGYQDDLLLQAPMMLSLDFLERDFRVADLQLMYWDRTAAGWIPAAQTCSPAGEIEIDLQVNRITVTACRLGSFALVEVWSVSHLPLIGQQMSLPRRVAGY